MQHSPIRSMERTIHTPHLGVYISYRSDETEELTHLVDFLVDRFRITSRTRKNKSHPTVQIGDNDATIAKLVLALPLLEEADTFVAIGFHYPTKDGRGGQDVLTFRAYLKHVIQEPLHGLENVRICYSAAMRIYFPEGKDLH
jgi:hypothetical protein